MYSTAPGDDIKTIEKWAQQGEERITITNLMLARGRIGAPRIQWDGWIRCSLDADGTTAPTYSHLAPNITWHKHILTCLSPDYTAKAASWATNVQNATHPPTPH